MAYNRFLYNTALYNAGREEVGAVARSIIQAHTGPHIQAVVGQTPFGPPGQSGISFLSDFDITEGTVKKPPASFRFPDLSAVIWAVPPSKDLPAAIFLVDKIPDLLATIFALLQKDLGATIAEKLFIKIITSDEKDLPGLLQVLPAIVDLLAEVTPSGGYRELGAKIHTPLDLSAFIKSLFFQELPGYINPLQVKDMPGSLFPIPGAVLAAIVRGVSISDLPAVTTSRDESDVGAILTSSIPGPNDIIGGINPGGGFDDIRIFLRALQSGTPGDLRATIGKEVGVTVDLPAIIDLSAARHLAGLITAFAVGERDRFLPASLQPVRPDDLGAFLITNDNLKNLGAFIEALRDTSDLGAFLRVAETFVTAILTVTTLAARDLRATIGDPECEGGSGNLSLAGELVVQHARNLGALIDSFIESNLGAVINTGSMIHAMDLIDVLYSRTRVRNSLFFATDTIDVIYARFRGDNLGAFIQGTLPNVDLGASLTAAFPLPAVTPFVSRLLAADLRPGEDLDIQEVRFQLEGALLEYFYVHGTDLAFIRDAKQDWKINVRSFRPIAENMFGDFAAARVCRRGDVTSYATLDEAVRACIAAVLGLEGEANIGATIRATGQLGELLATLGVSDVFTDLGAIANRVYPADFGATVSGTGGFDSIKASILAVGSTAAGLPATIEVHDEAVLSGTITGVP